MVERKLLIVDDGSRGHKFAKDLRQCSEVGSIYVARGNGGTSGIEGVENLNINPLSNDEVVQAAQDLGIDFVVIAPEGPLVNGVVDALKKVNIDAFGPTKSAAQIEGSKSWAMTILRKNKVPHPEFVITHSQDEAHAFINNLPDWAQTGLAIKADGLKAGKGVIVTENPEEAHHAIENLGEELLVMQEKLVGYEVSIQVIVSEDYHVTLPSSEDHKQIFDGDQGDMTGGMGVAAPHQLVTQEIMREIETTIVTPLIKAMKKEGRPFTGLLYPALFMTKNGPKVIEVNARPGGPEWETVSRLLRCNMYQVLKSTTDNTLQSQQITLASGSSVSVILASNGYPDTYQKGYEVHGLEREYAQGVEVYHAGTQKVDDKYVNSGGRVVLVSSLGENVADARAKAYAAIGPNGVHFEGMQYRRDIGIRKRINL